MINSTRNEIIDILRGLMLVLIMIDHFGGPISRITYQPFGFVSAFEGFVFLSGFVYSLVYSRYITLNGYNTIIVKSLKRALVIYKYQVLVGIFVIVLSSCIVFFYSPDDFLLTNNLLRPILLNFILLFQPMHLEVLPLYFLFVLAAPLVLILFSRGKENYVLFFSFLLWILGQFDFLFEFLHDYGRKYSIPIGSYNVLAWQIAFVFGMWVCWKFKIKKDPVPYNKFLVSFCLLIVFVFFVGRQIVSIYKLPHSDLLLHKENLRVLRLLNFVLLVYIIGWVVQNFSFIKSSFLSFLGKHSLIVFSFQILLIYSIHPFRKDIAEKGIAFEAIICTLLVISLLIPAWLHDKYKKNKIVALKSNKAP